MLSGMLMTFSACSDDDWAPGEPAEGAGVYFPTTLAAQLELSADANSFTVEVKRSETTDAATVNITATDESGLFDIPASVSFAAGSDAATLTIGYEPEELGYGNFYNLTLTLDETVSTPYAPSLYSVTVGIPQTWTAVAMGDYDYSLFFGAVDPGLTLYRCDQVPTRYWIPNWGYGVDFYFTYDEATGNVIVDDQATGYNHSSYGPVSIVEFAIYADDPSAGYGYVEGNTIYFSVIYYVNDGYFAYGYETFTITEGSVTGESAVSASAVVKAGKQLKVKEGLSLHMK